METVARGHPAILRRSRVPAHYSLIRPDLIAERLLGVLGGDFRPIVRLEVDLVVKVLVPRHPDRRRVLANAAPASQEAVIMSLTASVALPRHGRGSTLAGCHLTDRASAAATAQHSHNPTFP